jgi:hypothetical protein
MGRLIKLIGSGIGFTSEAIHAARNRSSNQESASSSSITPNHPGEQGSEYVIADNETADALIREGRAELPAYSDQDQLSKADQKKMSKAAEAGYASDGYGESNSSDDVVLGVDQDEAVWELDETAQRVRPPAYEEFESTSATTPQTEEAKEKQDEDIVRSLVQMAGPVQTVQRIPCPVIIPQRRPGKKDRGFVRAYAPVLGDCGINQDVFLAFLEGFSKSSKVSCHSFLSLLHGGMMIIDGGYRLQSGLRWSGSRPASWASSPKLPLKSQAPSFKSSLEQRVNCNPVTVRTRSLTG